MITIDEEVELLLRQDEIDMTDEEIDEKLAIENLLRYFDEK